jgi:hypothetical protein
MKTQFSPFPLWELIMEFPGHDTTVVLCVCSTVSVVIRV